ncbi:potassium-transporting ATPase subunit C, partial [Pseudomonas sp. 1]|nr:potassium-transporting ATPase subunit C [Pseudomonas sp. 1]
DATLRPLIGPPVVNVLALNQALERLAPLAVN